MIALHCSSAAIESEDFDSIPVAELLEYTLDKGAGPMGWERTKRVGSQEGKEKGWEGAK